MNSVNDRKVILITGASTGIGLALARLLRNSSKFRVIATARYNSLQRFFNANLFENEYFHIRPLDVTSTSEQQLLIEEIVEKWGRLDFLVNNAGISYRAVIEDIDQDSELKQFLTNYWAPLSLTRLALPLMRQQQEGHIINISSVGGMMAMPTMGLYSASKFALEGASEALWYEVRPWNIHVTLVEPGFINSEAFTHVQWTPKAMSAVSKTTTPYHMHYHYMSRFIGKMMGWTLSSSENIAKKIVKVMEQPNPPLRLMVTPDAWFFGMIRRFVPRRWYHGFLYRSLPHIKEWERHVQKQLIEN
ncbi:MAG: SDR family oxidoreductase [SAR324 cluster bacterium]|nr:SDR family oxidoreductase [SAR324 cluster bacterium]